ncbi:hypothetical protein FPZ12_032170 [Amycolatopsis acidicola]|uniref:Uncharacterized protein n=1 Tax=Amycolatopsis acidicola TaxID=2596893 RepID=A0A5N0UVI5_9PSEU|nr:hypothetical protein FPZ12_032170 [Amycolatopsis acidicola]
MSGVTGNSVSAGTGSDVRTFAAALLLTYGAGTLILVGYLLLDSAFGGILGLVGAVFGVVWWRSLHDKIFPRDLPVKSVVILLVVDVVLSVLAFVL